MALLASVLYVMSTFACCVIVCKAWLTVSLQARAGASVLFTDLPDYLDLLQGNIASCLPPSDASRCMVSQLDWFNVSTGVEAGWSKPDLIVAADCVYKEV